MAPHAYRRGLVPRQASQASFPSGDATLSTLPTLTVTTLVGDSQAPSGAPGLDPPTFTITPTPTSTPLMSPTSIPTTTTQSPQMLSTKAIIGLSVGLFVLSVTIMVTYMILLTKKRTANRERRARYTTWSKRSSDQKHERSHARFSLTSLGLRKSGSISRPSPVRLRIRIPSLNIPPLNIPNPFLGSPMSPRSMSVRSTSSWGEPPLLLPIQYAHNQPVLRGIVQPVTRVPKWAPPPQRAMSMSALSDESDYGDDMAKLGDVEITGAERPFSGQTLTSDDAPSVKSFIQPATTIPPLNHHVAPRPLSLRKPVPVMGYLPDIIPPPFPEKAMVSDHAPFATPTRDPPVYHPYKLAAPMLSPSPSPPSPPPQPLPLSTIPPSTPDPPVYHPYEPEPETPTATPVPGPSTNTGTRPLASRPYTQAIPAPRRTTNSTRPRGAAMQALIDALRDAETKRPQRAASTGSRQSSRRPYINSNPKLQLVGQAGQAGQARPRSVWSALSVSDSDSSVSLASPVARGGPSAVDFPLPPDSAATERFVLTPTREQIFPDQVQSGNSFSSSAAGIPRTTGRRYDKKYSDVFI